MTTCDNKRNLGIAPPAKLQGNAVSIKKIEEALELAKIGHISAVNITMIDKHDRHSCLSGGHYNLLQMMGALELSKDFERECDK